MWSSLCHFLGFSAAAGMIFLQVYMYQLAQLKLAVVWHCCDTLANNSMP